MAKRCVKCGHLNENERLFCAMCGDPLEDNLRLINNLEKMSKNPHKTQQPEKKWEDDDDEIPPIVHKEETSHVGIWVTVGIVVVLAAVGAWWVFLR